MVRSVFAPRDDFEQYRALFRNARTPTAAFGDSHVENAILTSPEIVNLGSRGETLPLMLSKAEAYVKSGRGKRVILQFAPQQFAVYRSDLDKTAVEEELWGTSEPILQFTRPHFRKYLLEYWRALIEDPRLAFAAPAPAPAANAGPAPASFADLPAAEQRRIAEIRVQLHAPLPGGPIAEDFKARFTALLDELHAKKIETCVVEYPLSSAYRAGAAKVASFAALRAQIRVASAAHAARYVDLTESYQDAMFGDPDHVARNARAAVTRAVLDECFGTRAPAASARN
jgi:hypothetical protein